MTIPIITNIKIPIAETTINIEQDIRSSISAAGFASENYDNYYSANGEKNWVIQHESIFLKFRLTGYAGNPSVLQKNNYLFLQMWLSWDATFHLGQSGSVEIVLDCFYDATSVYDQLLITAISHSEIKGLIWSQGARSGSLYYVTPNNIFNGFGYENANWGFVTSAFDFLYEAAITNPFNDIGTRSLESWPNLKYKMTNGTYQLKPSPRILSPNSQGFLGSFSSDICLSASHALPWKYIFTSGGKEYLLIRAKYASGIAILLD